jgi:hypothetical protein
LLDIQPIVVPVVPDVEFVVERDSFLFTFFFLERQQYISFFDTNRLEFLLQIVEELNQKVSDESIQMTRMPCVVDTLR